MAECLIALGCNQGNCSRQINKAVRAIQAHPANRSLRVSRQYETRPVGNVSGLFLNAAARFETKLKPPQLLEGLHSIEQMAGRDRSDHVANRPIDLDILMYDDQVIDQPGLQVPHPRMAFRRFVMEPAVEIAGQWVHPILNRTLAELLQYINRQRDVVSVLVPPDRLPPLKQQIRSMPNTAPPIVPPTKVTRQQMMQFSGQSPKHPDVVWIAPSTFRETLLFLRQQVVSRQQWLVIATDDPGLLERLKGTFKLLVTIQPMPAKDSSSDRLLPDFPGPRWSLSTDDPVGLIEKIESAIDAMRPIAAPSPATLTESPRSQNDEND